MLFSILIEVSISYMGMFSLFKGKKKKEKRDGYAVKVQEIAESQKSILISLLYEGHYKVENICPGICPLNV